MLASHKMINVKLVRRVHFSQDASQAAAHIEGVEDVEKAVWWAPLDDDDLQEGPNVRRYSGEIHLRKELQPSCDFFPFRVSYFVELHSFDPSVFKLSGPNSGYDPAIRHLALYPVRIGTLLGDGPAPVPFTKPSKSNQLQEMNFNSGTAFSRMRY